MTQVAPVSGSGVLVNSVVHTSGPNGPGGSGEKNGPPQTGFSVRIDSVVHTSGPIGSGGPGDEDSPTRIGSDDLIYSVVRVNSVNNVVRVSRPGWLG